ncbi:MAG: ABC transporter permease subunit [Vicinamibacterales bacterium]
MRDAAACGLSPWQRLWRIEAPLAWPGILTAVILTFAHTLGEIRRGADGRRQSSRLETRTLSIAIYDRACRRSDDRGASVMAATLLAVAVVTLVATTSPTT